MSGFSRPSSRRGAPFRKRPILALRAGVLAVVTPLLFRLPLPKVERVLRPRRASIGSAADAAGALWAAELGLRAVRWPLRTSCLHRGAVRYHLLGRAGIDVQLVFGAGHVDGAPAAHCWLLLDGQPYLESTDPREVFAPLYIMGSSPGASSGGPIRGDCVP
jgi:hypothetical protein